MMFSVFGTVKKRIDASMLGAEYYYCFPRWSLVGLHLETVETLHVLKLEDVYELPNGCLCCSAKADRSDIDLRVIEDTVVTQNVNT